MKKQKGKNQKWEFTRKDYRKYQFTVKEAAKYLLEGAVICAAVDYLFYQSLLLLLFMLPLPVLFLKIQKKKCIVRQKRNLNYQFRDALKLPSSSFSFYESPHGLKIATVGKGHGFGMSQWTAQEMAKDGKNYEEILQYFYEGTELHHLDE